MTYLLMTLIPLVMAGVCLALRQQQTFVLILAIITTLLLAWMAWRLPLGTGMRRSRQADLIDSHAVLAGVARVAG